MNDPAPSQRRIRVLSVDDHPLLSAGIAALIELHDDMEVVGQASTGAEGIDLFRSLMPDITLMDLRMPDLGGAEVIAAIRGEFPAARIVVLTTYRGDAHARRALLAGASGYLLKSALREELIDTIRSVHQGQHRISSEVAQDIAEHLGDDLLSPREVDVLRGVSSGLSNKVIARQLRISDQTVKDHMARIMSKLSASNRTHAITIALSRGIIG
ncbi:response regulator [Luteibacter rhizovicinus]|nr:response regulator transcription factor [Luteibacter rhizovicinus]